MNHKIGFFGGCFNPVTKAHLDLIKNAINKYNLSKVYFVPMGDLYEKSELIPLKYRIEMLELILKNEEKMDILNISNNDKKTNAIDTFKIIDEKFWDTERFFIMGSDNYEKISTWKDSGKLLTNYKYIVLDRECGGFKNVSSTLVRQKIKQEEDVSELLSEEVEKYIKQMKLYK